MKKITRKKRGQSAMSAAKLTMNDIRRRRDSDVDFPLPSTLLRYQKENIVSVCRSYLEWREQVGEIDAKERDAIRKNIGDKWTSLAHGGGLKNIINSAGKDESRWHEVPENLFDAMTAAMEHHGVLTVLDDGLLLRNIEGFLYHSLVGLIHGNEANLLPSLIDGEIQDHPLSPHLIVGRYKVFQPSMIEMDRVLLGDLSVETSAPTVTKTTFKQKIKNRDDPIHLHGTIVRLDKTRYLLVDRGIRSVRFSRLTTSIPVIHGQEEAPKKLFGWSFVIGAEEDGANYVRKIILERVGTGSPDFGTEVMDLDDSRIDDAYRKHLGRNGNSMQLYPFSDWSEK